MWGWAIHQAAKHGHAFAVLELILRQRVGPPPPDSERRDWGLENACHTAAKNGHVDVFLHLVSFGADPTHKLKASPSSYRRPGPP
jgi:ankyrin repeat protein